MRKNESAATATFSDGAAGDAAKMTLKLIKPPASDNDVLMLSGPAKLGYKAEAPILRGAVKLERGQRVVVLGPNGKGFFASLGTIGSTGPLIIFELCLLAELYLHPQLCLLLYSSPYLRTSHRLFFADRRGLYRRVRANPRCSSLSPEPCLSWAASDASASA